uniref:5'-tyrosyl-DNA phosphodiesterase n=1 Tax=Ditylenchus dipsaci TaxID=166011 RepID=A0A915DAQ5_9BILA
MSNDDEYIEHDDKSDDECEENIRQFAEITNTDEAFAHAMLQDDNFDLQAALAKFFSGQQADDLSGDILEVASSTSTVKIQTQQITQVPPKKKFRRDNEFPAELSMVSWNVDATEAAHLNTRFKAVLYLIAKINPEVIFLQEVTDDVMQALTQLMEPVYNMFVSNPTFTYYCVTLVSKNIEVERHEIIEFDTSMGRKAILIEAQWQKLKLKLINSHLESMKEHSGQRSKQFEQCISKLDALSRVDPSNTLAIFGGDLNLRDEEVCALPKNIKDAWKEAGSKMQHKFSWDMLKNDNHKNYGRARCRFDRIYYSGPYVDVDFSLQGTQRIKQIYCFPSDHFGSAVALQSSRTMIMCNLLTDTYCFDVYTV